VRALERAEDRKALRLAHPQLRDAVGEATTKLRADFKLAAAPRPPTPACWPRLEELTLQSSPGEAALKALGTEPWARLRTLRVSYSTLDRGPQPLRLPAARALGAALRRMPALREFV
jgi:hypothetical protein